MLADELRALLRAPEFVPFTVHVTDGASFHVRHPDYAWLVPNNAVLYVFEKNAGQRINLSLISRVEASEDASVAS